MTQEQDYPHWWRCQASGDQPIGSQATIKVGDRMTSRYVYNDATENYEQYVNVKGKQVSKLSTSSGHAIGFGSALECAETDCSTVPAHEWVDTVITMDTPDPNYANTFDYNRAEVGEGLYTTDNGKTWKLDSAKINEFTFT